MSAMNGLSDMRSGYFTSALPGRQALGLGGDVVGLLQLVEQVGAQAADHAGGAGGADHDHRHPQVLEHRDELAPSSSAGRDIAGPPGRRSRCRTRRWRSRAAPAPAGSWAWRGRGSRGRSACGRRRCICGWPSRRRSGTRPTQVNRMVANEMTKVRKMRSPITVGDRQVVLERVAEVAVQQAAKPRAGTAATAAGRGRRARADTRSCRPGCPRPGTAARPCMVVR